MREERDGGIRHHTEIRHVDVRCQGGNVVWPDGDKRILENRGFTDFGSYVDNLASTPYRPWQTVAEAEGER
jgi:hypothetical protein